MLQAGFEPELSGISARRLLQFGLPQRNQCHRWDSNPHYPDSETGASCRLGYRGNSAEAAGVEPARPRKGPPGFRDQSPRQWGQSFQYFSKSTTGVEPVRIRACNPAADRRHRARTATWVRKDSNLRRSHGDSRSTVWRNRRSATHPNREDEPANRRGGEWATNAFRRFADSPTRRFNSPKHRLVRDSNPF